MASNDEPAIKQPFPAIEPFNTGMLKVSDIHEVYYEQSGQPDGKPVIFVHGGPGGGCNPNCRRFFDPDVYRIILMDQRGCGKSKPSAELKENTTWQLMNDLEKLREHLGIDRWIVFGGSWGSTLSLTYAINNPERVKALILRGIFTLRREELLWLYQEGTSYLYPDYWQDYINPIPKAERGDLMSAYYRRLTGDDPEEREKCARSWSQWELRTSTIVPNHEKIEARLDQDMWALSFARIECHYFVHGGWFDDPEYILNNADKLRNIPCTIVQGRYDLVTPMKTAWELHQRIPESEFIVVQKAGHSVLEPDITSALITATEKYKDL